MTRRSFLTCLLFGLFDSRAILRALASSATAGHWFPGIIHAHSTFSDGIRSANDVIKKAVASGAKFLIETDHYEQIASSKRHSFQTHKDFGFANYQASFQSTSDLLVLAGAEIIARSVDHNTHTLALGKIAQDSVLDRLQGREGTQQDIINRLSELGLLSVAAHPSAISAGSLAKNPSEPTNYFYDRNKAKGLRGLEVFNENGPNSAETLAWYLSLSAKNDIFVTSGCDEHYPFDKDDSERWSRLTYIWSEGGLSAPGLIAALGAGRMIAAQNGAVPISFNHSPGFGVQSASRPDFFFTFELPTKAKRKNAKLYRDGKFLGLAAPENTLKGERYHFFDTNCPPGRHRYVIEIEDYLITSPIVLQVSDDFLPRIGYGWQRRDREGLTPDQICRDLGTKASCASGAPVSRKTLEGVRSLEAKSKSGAFYAGKVYELDGRTRCDVHAELNGKPLSETKDRDHRTWIMVLEGNQWKLWDIVEGYVNW